MISVIPRVTFISLFLGTYDDAINMLLFATTTSYEYVYACMENDISLFLPTRSIQIFIRKIHTYSRLRMTLDIPEPGAPQDNEQSIPSPPIFLRVRSADWFITAVVVTAVFTVSNFRDDVLL